MSKPHHPITINEVEKLVKYSIKYLEYAVKDNNINKTSLEEAKVIKLVSDKVDTVLKRFRKQK